MNISSFGNDQYYFRYAQLENELGSSSNELSSSSNRTRPKNKFPRFLLTIVGVITVLYLAFIFFRRDQPQIEAVIISSSNIAQSAESILGIESKKESSPLRQVIVKSLEGVKGTYSITIKNLKTGEEVNLDDHREYEAGSLYKLWVMATVFKKIEDGSLKEDQILSADVETLNKKFGIDPELTEQKTGVVTLSVNNALKQMITISHNYAALLLTEKVRLSSVANFLSQNGFNESKVGTEGDAPTTTSADIAQFFEKLYKDQLASKENTDKMIELLKLQKLNKKLPKYLPDDTIIAHKTGELGYFTHDAGIVYLRSKEASPHSERGDYIIVVLSESSSPKGAEDRIAKVSKAVYDYFKEK